MRRESEREIKLIQEYWARLISDVVTGKLDFREAVAPLPDATIEIAVFDKRPNAEGIPSDTYPDDEEVAA